MEQVFWIAGEKVTRSELNETKVRYVQGLLRTDYERGVRPRCLCKTPGVDMSVRKLPSRYILARMPDSAERHHPQCDAFDLLARSVRGGCHESAIVSDSTGTTRINLDVSLTKRAERLTTAPVRDVTRPESPGKKRSRTTLLGVLRHAWQESGLNKWHPRMRGKRGWWTVHRFIGEYAESVLVNRMNLADILHVPEPFDKDRRQVQRDCFQDFMRRVAASQDGIQHYGIILAEVAAWATTPYGGRVDLKHLKEFPLWLGKSCFDEVARSFPLAIQSLTNCDRQDRVVGLFVVYAGKQEQRVHVQTAALMAVTLHWVPTDSSYESAIANALVEADRCFLKPVRYDADEECAFRRS